MKKSLCISFILLLTMTLAAQTTITGLVQDAGTSEALIFASVELIRENIPIKNTNTDIEGNYRFDKVAVGKYELVFSYVGFGARQIEINVLDSLDKITVDIAMSEGIELSELCVTSTRARRKSRKAASRNSNANRNINSIAATSAGVSSAKGRSLKIRGSRSNSTNIYIDGMRVSGKTKKASRRLKSHKLAQAVQNSEEYGKFVENQFISPLDEGYSTFSIDVDRASYSVVRRFLNRDNLPPPDAVRIEELVNYFYYDYPTPQSKEAFDVDAEYSSCPWNEKLGLLRVGIQGKKLQEGKNEGTNLVFLLDVSGSMSSQNKLPLLKRSFRLLIDNLDEEDIVSIVVYAGAAGTVLEPTSVRHKADILDALNKLKAGGSTAGAAGIELAYQLAEKNIIKGGNNRVILATDGDFNVGIHDEKELEQFIETKRDKGIFLTVLGFGMGNYKDNRLEMLADKGNGNYAYIDNIREAEKVFGHELSGTLFTIAKDVKIQIEFNPAYVQAYRLIGYENRLLAKEDFNNDKKDAGELGAGHQVTALYEIVPAGLKNEWVGSVDPMKYQKKKEKIDLVKNGEMCTVKLRYKQPDARKSSYLDFHVEADQKSWNLASENLQLAAGIAAWGMKLRNSNFSRDMSYADIHNICKKAKGEDPFGYRQELLQLIKSSELLEKTKSAGAYGHAE